ncbi:hypothetical protein Btru_028169 [Bulinus truncatus]|nr:hypothetical protein Btru_028169 [Bulinus truncatus]
MEEDSLCPSCSVPPILFKLFFWLGYCNSTMNPIIYTCSSLEFRRAFLGILCCRRCRTRPRVSLTEMQMRTKVPVVRHRHHLRRPHHHQQHHLNLSSFQMSRCSSSAPGGPSVMANKSPNGEQPLINPFLGCECVIPDCGKALGLIRYRDAKPVGASKCPSCSSNGHIHLKVMESTYRHEMSVYASIDHADPHRSCGTKSRHHCSVDRNRSPMVSADSSNSTLSSTSSLESPTRCRALPGHQSYLTNNANGHCKTQSSPGFDASDVGVITLSFYSLAETISCSD